MTDTQANNRRIARNTLMLYLRMLLTVAVGIYTSRVVLNTLGVEDYGIYNVVGGVVAMMGFLNASLAGATSRFITFELGRGDRQRLADTFSSALIAHIGIALAVVLVAETAGLWFLTHKLVIPEARMGAALWVYHLSIASAAIGITQVPYTACVIAHERMGVYAYMEILNSVLKLLIVYVLLAGHFDKLKLYATLTFAVSTLIAAIYRLYCTRKFAESHFRWTWNKEILRPMVSFSAWDVYGNLSVSANQQGTNMMLNMFFGPVVNAAAGVAGSITGIISGFANNVTTAFRPQIVKQYAQGNISEMQQLLTNAAKFHLLLFATIMIPLYIEIESVLRLWLGQVPPHSVQFCRATLLCQAIASQVGIINIAIHATGKIKRISFYSGSIYLFATVFVYIAIWCTGWALSAYVVLIAMHLCVLANNISITKRQISEFQAWRYLTQAFPKAIGIILLSAACVFGLSHTISQRLPQIFAAFASSVALMAILTFYLVFTASQRAAATKFVVSKFNITRNHG